MASFLQPAYYTPSNYAAAVGNSRFLIYTNNILGRQQRFQHWYQYALLAIGASFLSAALLKPLISWLLRETAKWRKKDVPTLADELEDFTRKPKDVVQQPSRSFAQYVGGDLNTFLKHDYDLHLMDLRTYRSRTFSPFQPKTDRKMSVAPGFAASGRRRSSIAALAHVAGMRKGSVSGNPPSQETRRPSLFSPKYQVDATRRRASIILPDGAPDEQLPSAADPHTQTAIDQRRPSAGFPTAPDARRPSVTPFSGNARRPSLFAAQADTRRPSLGPFQADARRPSLFGAPTDSRRPSFFQAQDKRRPSAVGGYTPDFRKVSVVAANAPIKGTADGSTLTTTLELPVNVWVVVDKSLWYPDESSKLDVGDIAATLRQETEYAGIIGLVIDTKDFEDKQLRRVCNECLQAGLDIMLLEDSNAPSTAPVYPLVAGIIFRNAAILPSGERRDFFAATKLRTALARCKMQQKTREDFFVGFLDLWASRPHSAVVRRAHKLAKFHKAAIHQAPAETLENSITPPSVECLGAFDWIKKQELIRSQHSWLSAPLAFPTPTHDPTNVPGFQALSNDPRLTSLVQPFRHLRKDSGVSTIEPTVNHESPPSYTTTAPPRSDFWSHSSQNLPMCNRGCYDLREELFEEQYNSVVETQRHLQKLGLLQPVDGTDLDRIIDILRDCMNVSGTQKNHLKDLISGLTSRSIKIFKGLDSGFRLPDNQGHFWGVLYRAQKEHHIFVSLKAQDIPMVVLHTYLAEKGVSRYTRLNLELDITAQRLGNQRLPSRLIHELQSATYSELIFMLEQMNVAGAEGRLVMMIRQECERLLIDEPSRLAFIQMQCNDLLAGRVTIRDVLKARLDLLAKAGAQNLPALDKLVEAAMEMERVMQRALFEADEVRLNALSQPVIEFFDQGPITLNPSMDLYALTFFCGLRRQAFEEVYLETTDRCPLFLQQKDQAAVFAEMWALGSQCEVYFGIKPRALGAIIYDRYRKFLEDNPPSTESSKIAELFTAYQLIDAVDNDSAMISTAPITMRQRFEIFKAQFASATFLTVFCIPAIVDVCLLTFLGRGLYLTAFMDREERTMANYAVLASLAMTSGVTGWTGSSGGFYLHSAAFNNMNHFMVQRVSGGSVLTLIFAVCGFIAFGFEYSWYGGFIFAAYLVVISTYLNILGVLTTMHRNNSPFKSGRTVLLSCMLILLVSPILTTFVNGHDVLVYLLVLYFFLFVQIYTWIKLARTWVTWMDNVNLISEKDIMQWYEKKQPDSKLPKHLQRSQASNLLTSAIKSFSFKADKKGRMRLNSDPLVEKVARGHEYTMFMLKQDEPDSPLPDPYGPTWLTRMKLALENQRQLAHGLKEHSPFLLFRKAKYDIAQNVGFFLVVLMDRWVAVSMSANGHIVNLYYDVRSRYAIAFALLYFLMCAVSLDIILQRYWGKTGRQSISKLTSLGEMNLAELADASLGRRRWLTAISELLSIMVGVFGFTTIFLWLLVYQSRQVIMYLSYISGYSGALFFQFNRVFTTNVKTHVQLVFACSAVAYVVGCVLHEIPATKDFFYNDIIALNTASVLSAFTTWLYTDFTYDAKVIATGDSSGIEDTINWKTYSQKLIGSDDLFDRVLTRPPASWGSEIRFTDETSLSKGIRARFIKATEQYNNPVVDAFEEYREVLEQILGLWEDGSIRLFIIPRREFINIGGTDRLAFSIVKDEALTILLGMPELSSEAGQEVAAQIAAETLLHEACEGILQMRHAHATLMELLLNQEEPISTRMAVQLAETSKSELAKIVARTNQELLTHLCLGVNPDITWEQTPESVRATIVARVLGRSFPVTPVLEQWLLDSTDSLLLRQLSMRQCLAIRALAQWRLAGNHPTTLKSLPPTRLPTISWQERLNRRNNSLLEFFSHCFKSTYRLFFHLIQFVAVITTAGPDAGRELWYTLPNNPTRMIILWPVLKFWKACWLIKEAWMYTVVYSQDPEFAKFRRLMHKGGSRILTKGRVVLDDPVNPETCFIQNAAGKIKLQHYHGTHTVKPDKEPYLITCYDEKMRLLRAEYLTNTSKQTTVESGREKWLYSYDTTGKSGKYPTYKSRKYMDQELKESFDKHGRITKGECVKAGEVMEFSYTYKSKPKNSKEILHARYTIPGQQDTTTWDVFWCNTEDFDTENLSKWTNSQRITRLVKSTGKATEEVRWAYGHRRDPTITRWTSPKQTSGEPSKIEIEAKRYGIIEKPSTLSYWDENMLLGHSKSTILNAASIETEEQDSATPQTSRWKWLRQLRGQIEGQLSVNHYPLSTSTLRTGLWKYWTAHPEMSAVVACELDEMMLRRTRILRPYWAYRDAGRYLEAKHYIAKHLIEIINDIEVGDDVSAKLNLAIRPADLFTMGTSKDSNYIINAPEDSYIDTEERLAVIFTDTGCWPDAPGGVSNCRRDLVDGHSTIRNYALTESAYDWSTSRFQIEKNVQMVKNLALWGLDGKTPSHGLYDNLLQAEVDRRTRDTTNRDIKEVFIPLLNRIIRGARTIHNSKEDLLELTVTFLRLNEFFETRDYTTTWRSNAVKRAWRLAWLEEYNDPNIQSLKNLFPMERPARQDFEEAMELYIGYFFILGIRIPEKVPRVYQSTHHGIGSLFGMCLKLRRGVAWGIWDHAILWRESCLNISTAQCFLPIPVQNMLLGTMKVASHLAYLHADVILPCTDTFNPIWEIDIGTDQGCLASRALMARKIDPITNGIANMDHFVPIEKIRTADPTVVMLSNVQFIKDVKNAIQAAGVIINDFGFKTYNLVVYGAQDRQPSYAVETEELIASLGIGQTVKLGGFGRPQEVLKDAWLFMNSSLSEGLPLAIGEAALAGIPIVATEVGATAQVLTDVDDPSIRYGEIVSPNDPVALARAQISILALLGPWAKFTKDDTPPPPLPSKFTPEDVEWITARMHAKVEDRRKLGMKLREVVIRKFNGDRYLREHEQMFWVQRHMAEQRADKKLEQLAAAHVKFNQPLSPRYVEFGRPSWVGNRWQAFGEKGPGSTGRGWSRSTAKSSGSWTLAEKAATLESQGRQNVEVA